MRCPSRAPWWTRPALTVAMAAVIAPGPGCVEARFATCEDGTVCPSGFVCSPGGCVPENCGPDCCGDGIRTGAEQCDGSVTNDECVAYDLDDGLVTCSSTCTLDFSACDTFGWRRVSELSTLDMQPIDDTRVLLFGQDEGLHVVDIEAGTTTPLPDWDSSKEVHDIVKIGNDVHVISHRIAPAGEAETSSLSVIDSELVVTEDPAWNQLPFATPTLRSSLLGADGEKLVYVTTNENRESTVRTTDGRAVPHPTATSDPAPINGTRLHRIGDAIYWVAATPAMLLQATRTNTVTGVAVDAVVDVTSLATGGPFHSYDVGPGAAGVMLHYTWMDLTSNNCLTSVWSGGTSTTSLPHRCGGTTAADGATTRIFGDDTVTTLHPGGVTFMDLPPMRTAPTVTRRSGDRLLAAGPAGVYVEQTAKPGWTRIEASRTLGLDQATIAHIDDSANGLLLTLTQPTPTDDRINARLAITDGTRTTHLVHVPANTTPTAGLDDSVAACTDDATTIALQAGSAFYRCTLRAGQGDTVSCATDTNILLSSSQRLVCAAGSAWASRNGELWRYDLAGGTWQEFAGVDYDEGAVLSPVPGGALLFDEDRVTRIPDGAAVTSIAAPATGWPTVIQPSTGRKRFVACSLDRFFVGGEGEVHDMSIIGGSLQSSTLPLRADDVAWAIIADDCEDPLVMTAGYVYRRRPGGDPRLIPLRSAYPYSSAQAFLSSPLGVVIATGLDDQLAFRVLDGR